MNYLDSGTRAPEQALGQWLQNHLKPSSILELRWQSGYFSADALGFFADALAALAANEGVVSALIGSNDRSTVANDVVQLLNLVRLPRKGGRLGVVSFSGSIFHPKVYHVVRRDGSQCAYVGSANLTSPGLTALHVEAGITLDTATGDDPKLLSNIATAIDAWFTERREGVYLVDSVESVDELMRLGILAAAPQPRPSKGDRTESETHDESKRARLKPLIVLPRFAETGLPQARVGERPKPASAGRPPVPREGFPSYLLFEQGLEEPTSDAGALSGSLLPGTTAGLILRLNRDSARHFAGNPGTANISVPVATLSTLRFGIYKGKFLRPRAEFQLQMSYVGNETTLKIGAVRTNIMAYGFAPGETGHGDVRMVVPAPARKLAALIRKARLPTPVEGDFALLEWPTRDNAEFRLTFLEKGSELFVVADRLFSEASASGSLVGDGACWLPQGLAPV